MKHIRWSIILIIALLWSSIASAQGGAITYGETRTEALSAAAPQVLYNLQGNMDEVVTIYVLGWVQEFQPTITVLGPTGQLAFTNSDNLTPISNDARVTVKLPQAGNYSILVGSATAGLGNFTIAVRQTTAGISTQLDANPVTINIPPGGESLTYSIPANPNGDIPLTISNGTPDFMYSAQISAPDGRILATFDGSMSTVTVNLPAGTDMYTLVVKASDATMSGTLTISQTGAVAPVTGGGTTDPAPVVTEEVTGGNQPPANECAAVAGTNGANVRTGPSTDFQVLRVLAPNDFMIVTAQNNGWYTDGQGWVAGSVVTLTGPCDNLGIADASAPPPPTATAVPPTTEAVQATPTYTATVEVVQATPTYTPTTAAPQAIVDSDQLNMNVDRDNGGTYTNDVSSPEGDTTDRVRIVVDNLTNQPPNSFREFSILVTCAGADAANLRWGTGGPNSPNSRGCNEAITAIQTNDSNQTFLNIAMEGPGYVQYTIIVTITG